MKRVLSRMLVASGLLLGASALSTPSFAADGAAGPAKPDAAKGGQLFDQGDASRGIIACQAGRQAACAQWRRRQPDPDDGHGAEPDAGRHAEHRAVSGAATAERAGHGRPGEAG
ncbi:hypothetical protein G6F59_017114 [Rhizopus arrhizus]|nr:hypothetical protein G6F59_017114 [Rhizopus arrhizus]